MPSATVMDKAARAFAEGRIRVNKLTPDALTLECRSSHFDVVYLATFGRDDRGTLRSCSCANGRVHPVHPRCWHVRAAELLADHFDGSHR